VRVVHLTDLHVQRDPSWAELRGKRWIGTANLVLLGRRAKFSEEVQRAAVQAAVDAGPDLAIVTGDLTAQALPAELEAARALLDPLLAAAPTFVIPGNHDTYLPESQPGDAVRAAFPAWTGPRAPWLFRVGDAAVLHLETCRPHLLSSGHTPPDQLEQATALLTENDAPFTFLAMHYPLRDRRGAPYGPFTRALSNAAEVEAWLARTSGVQAVLHGHEHHGYRTELPTADGPVPSLNPGSSGYAHQPERGRRAHINVYDIDGDRLVDVTRLAYTPEGFRPEPGGAYTSGG
jgi:3',5'-cyclic AMP phosphodiesterase CpdA